MIPRAPLLPMGEAVGRAAAVLRRPAVPRHLAAPAVRVPIIHPPG